jgi:hypothetical protein
VAETDESVVDVEGENPDDVDAGDSDPQDDGSAIGVTIRALREI